MYFGYLSSLFFGYLFVVSSSYILSINNHIFMGPLLCGNFVTDFDIFMCNIIQIRCNIELCVKIYQSEQR